MAALDEITKEKQRVSEALARVGVQERNLARCRGLFNAGQACCFMGQYKEAVWHAMNETGARYARLIKAGPMLYAVSRLGERRLSESSSDEKKQ